MEPAGSRDRGYGADAVERASTSSAAVMVVSHGVRLADAALQALGDEARQPPALQRRLPFRQAPRVGLRGEAGLLGLRRGLAPVNQLSQDMAPLLPVRT